MDATFKYYLSRNYFIATFLVFLGLSWLYVYTFNNVAIVGYILFLFVLTGVYIFWNKPKTLKKNVFSQLDKMLGRSLVIAHLIGQIVAFVIALLLELKIPYIHFTLPFAFIIAGFCAGFVSYIQVRTLQATGLYDEATVLTDRLQEA